MSAAAEQDGCMIGSHPIGVIVPKRDDHDTWLPIDRKILAVADCLVVCDMSGWQESRGIRFEIDEFSRLDRPMFSACDLHVPEREAVLVELYR